MQACRRPVAMLHVAVLLLLVLGQRRAAFLDPFSQFQSKAEARMQFAPYEAALQAQARRAAVLFASSPALRRRALL